MARSVRDRERQRRYRAEHPERRIEENRRYGLRHPDKVLAFLHRKRELNPEKYQARTAVNNAIRDGVLIKQPCRICGDSADAHHEDYSKPLDVWWLCRKHHAERHRELKCREPATT